MTCLRACFPRKRDWMNVADFASSAATSEEPPSTSPPPPGSNATPRRAPPWRAAAAPLPHAEAAPRVSLTATLRRRGARSTALQELQGGKLGELGLDALPLPLRERVRHVAGSLLLYKWWYALGVGCVPERMVPES